MRSSVFASRTYNYERHSVRSSLASPMRSMVPPAHCWPEVTFYWSASPEPVKPNWQRVSPTAHGLSRGRIQFTPDLLPADILGGETLLPGSSGDRVEFRPGPVFTQLLIADEINRGTPRTQSALLEAMQEYSVTISSHRHRLDPLFSVIATRNPIEMEGTYPLPEAQRDRFLLEVQLHSPAPEVLTRIAAATTIETQMTATKVLEPKQIESMAPDGATGHRRRFGDRSGRSLGRSDPTGGPHGSRDGPTRPPARCRSARTAGAGSQRQGRSAAQRPDSPR